MDSGYTYQKNITALKEKSPEFFIWWQNRPCQYKTELIYTLSGWPNLKVETSKGKTLVLYNHDNPWELVQNDLKDWEFHKESITFIFGFGLGYKVWLVLEKMEEGHILFIIEDNPYILQLALSLHDFSDAIMQEKIIFCIPEEERIRRHIEQNGSILLKGKISLEMENFAPKLSPLYPQCYKSCQRLCNTLFLAYNTFISLSDIFMINELKNLPKAVPGYSTEGFCRGDFSNMPAILVATGPSLQKNIHLLKEAKGKALIIAVAQALRVLLAYDIMPDLICSIDFGEPNYLDLEDVIQDAPMPLLIDSRIFPRIPFEYQGDLIIPVCSDDVLFQKENPYQEKVLRGKTVAQMCLNLALAIGANPIIFMGQDLALSDSSHILGTMANRKVTIKNNKVIESGTQGTAVGDAIWVDGIYGGRVLTNQVLFGYLEDFESTIKNYPDRHFIDATEGGALIKGTKVMTLREVLDQYCQKEYNISCLIEQSCLPLCLEPKAFISDLEIVHLLTTKIIRLNKKLKKPFRMMKKFVPAEGKEIFEGSKDKKFEELYKIVRYGFDHIAHAINSHRIIRSPMAKIRHFLRQKENNYESDDSHAQKAKVMVKRYELADKGVETIIRPIKESLDKTLPYLKEYYNLQKKASTLKPSDFHFQMGICLKKMGHLKPAVKEFHMVLEEKDNHKNKEALRQLIEIYLNLEDFDKAQNCLNQLSLDSVECEKIRIEIESRKEKSLAKYLTKAHQRSLEGDFVNAVIYSRKVLKVDPGSALAKEILDKSIEQRQQKIASVQELGHKLKTESEDKKKLENRLSQAKQMIQENSFAEAGKLYHDILSTYPDHPDAHFGLARAFQGEKNWGGATEQIHWLIERYQHKALLYEELGNIYLAQGQFNKAFQEYRKAIEKDKTFAYLYLNMANTYVQAGQIQEAIHHYEDYLNLNPGDYNSLVKLGDCYMFLGIIDAARLGYEAALRIQPNYGLAQGRINFLNRLKPSDHASSQKEVQL